MANSNGKKKAGFICILDAYTLEIKKVAQVSKKPITTFCLSPDGSIIGFGTAELGLTVLEAKTLKVYILLHKREKDEGKENENDLLFWIYFLILFHDRF